MLDHKVSFEKVPQLELRIHNNAARHMLGGVGGFCHLSRIFSCSVQMSGSPFLARLMVGPGG